MEQQLLEMLSSAFPGHKIELQKRKNVLADGQDLMIYCDNRRTGIRVSDELRDAMTIIGVDSLSIIADNAIKNLNRWLNLGSIVHPDSVVEEADIDDKVNLSECIDKDNSMPDT